MTVGQGKEDLSCPKCLFWAKPFCNFTKQVRGESSPALAMAPRATSVTFTHAQTNRSSTLPRTQITRASFSTRTIIVPISNFTHSAAVRGRQDANNIYHLLRGPVRGARGARDLRPPQMDSAERGGAARKTQQLINKNRQQIKEDDYIKRQKLRGRFILGGYGCHGDSSFPRI